MRQAWIGLMVIFFILNCAPSEDLRSSRVADGVAHYQIISARYLTKGAEILCDQPSYRACLNIDRDQCLTELRPYTKACFDDACQKVDGRIVENQNFFPEFRLCMASKHPRFPEEGHFEVIAPCLDNRLVDLHQLAKTLNPNSPAVKNAADIAQVKANLRRNRQK